MAIKEYIEGQTVTIVIKTWEKGNEKRIKGILLEEKEHHIVLKPILKNKSAEPNAWSMRMETGYNMHDVLEYEKNHIFSIKPCAFPEEVASHIHAYYQKYKEQKDIREKIQNLQEEIQSLNEEIETIEPEKEKICEELYESYYQHAKGLETNFIAYYFQNKLENLWEELQIKKQVEGDTVRFCKPVVIDKNKHVVAILRLKKRHEHIPDVPYCFFDDCTCHSEAAENLFFEKYSHPFSLDSLKRFDITHRDSITCDFKNNFSEEITAYYINNEFEIHTNPQKLNPDRILELLSEFLVAYA